MQKSFGITKEEFFVFDAMRQCSQCLSKVIRRKTDYAIMVLADRRYSINEKYKNFPAWIQNQLKDSNKNLQADMAVEELKKYFKNMGQFTDAGNFPRELYFTQEDFPGM